ncbi:serine/threonine-protein kinase Nek [Acrasis kona]|uniref:Serine/threonine-protein kinase Nek n=1 Tax=Acrasis kona TaxID=1008807 RepID=A0AAW2ZRN2_9EUKA
MMDQYYVIQLLGKGSEGHVLKCQYKKTQEIVAIKRIEIDTPEKANTTLNEAYRLISLSKDPHPNIVPYKRVFIHKYPSAHTMNVCLVMEYCPNGDLQTAIQKYWAPRRERSSSQTRSSSPVISTSLTAQTQEGTRVQCMPESIIIKHMIDVCEGLSFLHDHGLIHRDLKPNNLFLSQLNTVKIGDFGTIRAHENGGQQDSLVLTMCGTPNFMSPEMLNNETYDFRTDLFSLGIILLQMLTGKSYNLINQLNADPNLLTDTLREEILSHEYNVELFGMMTELVSRVPSKRPTASECLKRLKKLQSNAEQSGDITFTNCNTIKLFQENFDSIWLHILRFLDCVDLYHTIMTVDKRFYKLSQNDQVIWKPLCQGRLGDKLNVKQETKFNNSFTIKNLLSKKNSVVLSNPPSQSHQNVSYKKQLEWYVLHMESCIKKRIKSTMGMRLLHEIRPNQLDETARLLAQSYEKHPMYYYILTGIWIDQDIDRYHETVLNQQNENKNESNQSSVAVPVVTDATVSITSETIQANRAMKSLTKGQLESLEAIMKEILSTVIKYGRVWVVTLHDRYNQSHVVATCLWQNVYNNVLGQKIRNRVLKSVGTLIGLGPAAVLRLFRVLDWQEACYNKIMSQSNANGENHCWKLYALATSPSERCQGYANQVLQPVIKSANEDQYPCYTTVTDVTNLTFFLRMGFVIVGSKNNKKNAKKQNDPFESAVFYVMRRTDTIYVHCN